VNAVAASYGANAFDNTASTSAQSAKSNATGTTSATINKVMWFAFTPTATGQFKIDMCGASGDTIIAIGDVCPSVGGRFEGLAYNDDACACSSGCGTTTQADWSSRLDAANSGIPLTGNLTAGATYYIVLGSFGTGSGAASGTLTISGPTPPPVCPADLNNDGQVNGADLGLLLGAWGPCAGTPCLGDLNLDGVVNGADLGLLLGAWGPCA
jgi:hypothetical protein